MTWVRYLPSTVTSWRKRGPRRQLLTQCLKVRLEKHFGDSVVFHQQSDKTKPELLYSSSIQVQDVLNGWAHLKKAKEREKGPDEDATKERDIARLASYIKAEIRKCKGISSRPLDVKDISQESTREVIPDSLYWLIHLIISPDDNRCLDRSSVCTNMVDERQVLSIALDVIRCCTKWSCEASQAHKSRYVCFSRDVIEKSSNTVKSDGSLLLI